MDAVTDAVVEPSAESTFIFVDSILITVPGPNNEVDLTKVFQN